MSDGFRRLQQYLDQEGVDYHIIHHRTDYRARATAADTDTAPEEFAKSVFLLVDEKPVMVVVPASKDVALSKVRKALGVVEVQLAREPETRELCADCEVGAAPPFGNLYGLPVYVSSSLAEDEHITFNGGSHENAFRMRYRDFERLVKPRVLALAKHDT